MIALPMARIPEPCSLALLTNSSFDAHRYNGLCVLARVLMTTTIMMWHEFIWMCCLVDSTVLRLFCADSPISYLPSLRSSHLYIFLSTGILDSASICSAFAIHAS